MLAPRPDHLVRLPATQQPLLLAVIDTEEEFDWDKPFSRSSVGVAHMQHQARAQAIFARFGLKPHYVIDYPVAENEEGYAPLREWAQAGTCEIGAHLHPWVNPPFEEPVNNRNSYPGNLPAQLERAKLSRLTDLIEDRFGARPVVYRAGRYGVGPNTAATLADLGYQIDTSVVPRTDFSAEDGPDFRRCGLDPYWIDAPGGLLEVPLSVGWTGAFAAAGASLQPLCRSGWGQRLRLQGLLSLAGLFDRIRLTPEGMSVDELCRLTRALVARGQRVFNFTYHSPSLMPGNTPYVRSGAELETFVGAIERYLAFFFGEIGGRAATMRDIRALCLASARRPAAGAPPADAAHAQAASK